MQVRTHQNDTVDQLCWRHLGQTERMVEATLELNPGLAAKGPVLPGGLAITLPDPATTPAAPRPTVNLWD